MSRQKNRKKLNKPKKTEFKTDVDRTSSRIDFNPALLKDLGKLELSERTYNCLKSAGIYFVGELVQWSEAEILRIPHFGTRSLKEIKKMLSQMGLHLGMKVEALTPENIESNPVLWIKLADLELSVRSSNCLKNERIVYIGDLIRFSETEMHYTPNFGKKSLKEIKTLLYHLGLHLGMKEESRTPENIDFNPGLLIKLNDLNLSVRSSNCLTNANLVYIGDLVHLSETELLQIPSFGKTSLKEIKNMLSQMSLHLDMEVKSWPPENIDDLEKRYDVQRLLRQFRCDW